MILLRTIFYMLFFTVVVYGKLPEGFVYLDTLDRSIVVELRYLHSNNFLGVPVEGYNAERLIITEKAGKQLVLVQKELRNFGLGLKVFDAYRPQQAVDHFARWAQDLDDTLVKASYYPTVEKSSLFKAGYIAHKSGHTRGSSVDLTIIDLKTQEELDMGAPFDFFSEKSHVKYPHLSTVQRGNRMLLQLLMVKYGFKPYSKEWWHFRLKNEPFPNSYFNFPVE